MTIKDSNTEKPATPLPWYREGLRFECTGCGKCCTGTPGFVWITEEEVSGMAQSLEMTVKAFKMKYVRHRDNRMALIEKKIQEDEFECIFLKDKKCLVYQNRPKQCRNYPWWQENLNTKESWDLAKQECEGINDEAPLFSCSKINELVRLSDSE